VDRDWYYPYYQLEGEAELSSDIPWFQHESGSGYPEGRWVHVSGLQEGQRVKVTPARFYWQYLESAAQRFKPALANEGWHWLEEYQRLRQLWQALKERASTGQLTEAQLRGVLALLEAKEQAWTGHEGEVNALAEAALRSAGLAQVLEERRADWRALRETVDLHMRVLKEKL